MITVGCDIGSLFTKAVVMDDDRLLSSRIVRTTGRIAREVEPLLAQAVADAGIGKDAVEYSVATGNAADLASGAAFTEDEVTCVAAAVGYYVPRAELIMHIGGQSIAAILLDSKGDVADFLRNDKCAAGSGRFIEIMCAKLNLDIADIDRIAAGSRSPLTLSSQCGVFAESEVISHLNEGKDLADIVAGICASVANLVVAQGRRFREARTFTLTGGVARIDAVGRVIRSKLTGDFLPFPLDPQLAAAVGAAMLTDED